ncbi:MAG: RodZ domain-containing protein [Gammaproteobacteria bacterium]
MDGGVDDSRRAGPGDRLRSARERRGLSVRDAATRLRLDPSVIEAIEADNFAALPAPIFVKGYLNAYARLLGIPAEDCIAEYTAAVDGAVPPPLVIRRGTGDGIESSSNRRIALVSWLVALVAIAMVVLWWYARPAPTPDVQAPPTRVASEPVHEPIADPIEVLADAAVDTVVPERVPEVVPERVPAPTAASDIAVRFTYRAESWTEIVDASGTRLYFDLARAGSVVEVAGEPPLAVFLGNSPGVDIEVDGRRFDQSRYNRSGNVARFSIDPP